MLVLRRSNGGGGGGGGVRLGRASSGFKRLREALDGGVVRLHLRFEHPGGLTRLWEASETVPVSTLERGPISAPVLGWGGA